LGWLPDNGYDADMLMRNADRAMYTERSNGRKRIESFSEAGAKLEEPETCTCLGL
jgi:hypothetical protein